MRVAVPAYAAQVSALSDTTTSHVVSAASNHTLSFTTGTGASLGSFIRLTFDGSFDTATITEDDVDVLDDGVQLTTAASCGGGVQTSVAMSGDQLDIAICVGGASPIVAGSVVTVRIGTNATSSGTGTNRITNPSTVGTYPIALGGNFGDTGNVWIPLISSGGSIPVSGSVSSGGGGGGGGGGGFPSPPSLCTDTTAPVIENVSAVPTANSVAILWQTSEDATSIVRYGLTTSYGSTETDTSLVQNHTTAIGGLSSGTVYQFQVESTDLCSNTVTSGNFSFTTQDTTPPVISEISADVSSTMAIIDWLTNELTTGTVFYGLTSAYGSSVTSPLGLTDEHEVILSGLTPSTLYHYKIRATDAMGNQTETVDRVFVTPAELPPANVSGLTATPGNGQVALSWLLPLETDLSSVRIVYRTDRSPTSPTDGTIILLGLTESHLHTGLANGTTYFYAVFVEDTANLFSSGALANATPTSSLPEAEEEEDVVVEEEEDESEDTVIVEEEPEDIVVGDEESTETILTGGDEAEEETGEDTDEAEEVTVEDLPEPSAGAPVLDLHYLVGNDLLELYPSENALAVLAGRSLTVTIPSSPIPADGLELEVGADLYLLQSTDEGLRATITVPGSAASLVLWQRVGDNRQVLSRVLLSPRSFGFTFEMLESERERVGYTRVQLFVREGGVFSSWDGSPFGELNPVTTAEDGTFAWYVPTGEYYVRAEGSGYRPAQTAPAFVTNTIVAMPIELRREPPPIIDVITSSAPTLLKLRVVADIIQESANETLEAVRESPSVQRGIDVAAPVLLATGVSSTVLLSASFNLVPFLQYLLTSPVLLLWRRRRKSWGVVYDAGTKMPIDLAIVRLYRLTDGRLLQTRVTDRFGRYFFLVDPGEYRLGVVKAGFTFPSGILRDRKEDGGYLDLYHGETVRVVEEHATVAANIPLDSLAQGSAHAPARVKLRESLRVLQQIVGVLGVLLSVVMVVIRPSVLIGAIALLQVLVYFFARRLARPTKPKGWGIVYDEGTRRPLAQVVVRVFEPVYNKLLATAVTDRKGRYSFLVGPNEYYARFEKDGYQPHEVKPIDLTAKKEPSEIAVDVSLRKKDV